ncbi:SixA phosphatase family protein [Shimia haliotis]|uniref:Phosphohistidine phosphatase n=1 Tax=Shimia haliotis TaxID=1280847 RepID=A0A1I4H5V5_9RHOB|nr:histidine phosphatase family protein [Shimia haliotis]SFL37658.1 phosphohistidine phosphatase [Shimia haliotis]
MTLKLILMRHAKSSWDDPLQSDHARPLNKRGRASASVMGKWLAENGYLPDELLCSTAERTRETYARLGLVAPETTFSDALYHASADIMLRVLQGARGKTVLMLGHNPGIGHCAELMARQAPDHPRFLDYPTCATTVFTFDTASWADVSFGQGDVLAFGLPRELLSDLGG